MQTLNEWMIENEKLCEMARSKSVSINDNFGARDDAGLIILPIALKIIRAAIDANSPDEVVELAEQIINGDELR